MYFSKTYSNLLKFNVDYYPYGMLMPGRHASAGDQYSYGYQGSEQDNEIKGEGNSYTTHFRMLDPRIGRWFSIDPKASAWESPYASMSNNPIFNNDVLGDSIRAGEGRTNSAWRVKGWLQLLTNDKLSVDKNGMIYIESRNTENSKQKLTLGTQFIRDLISENNTVEIKLVAGPQNRSYADATDNVAARDGRGSDFTVFFNPYNTPDLKQIVPALLKDAKSGKSYLQEFSDRDMELLHELIHAFYGMQGQSEDDKPLEKHTYKDHKGRTVTETDSPEEFKTTGFSGKRKYTENKMRKEHKRNERVSYQHPPH